MKADILIFYRNPTIPVNGSKPNANINVYEGHIPLVDLSYYYLYEFKSQTANRNSLKIVCESYPQYLPSLDSIRLNVLQ